MNFEQAYQKFLNGTATEEEIEFVREEMKKASAVNDVLQNANKESVTNEAEEGKIKTIIKKHNLKNTIKIFIIVACSLVFAALVAGISIAIPVFKNAKENCKYTEQQAEQIAIEYVVENYSANAENVTVRKVDRDLEVYGRIKNARYVYVLDVYNGVDGVIEIEIDSKTGQIIDVDRD